MRFSLAVAALFSSAVLAADHLVTVGDKGALAFNPTNVQVAQGDNVIFEFRAKNHSVTQSTFASPCTPMAGGVDSGFQATANTTTTFAQWKITIQNASAPIWLFCAQANPKNHCQAGMVFAINPTAEKSFDAYLQNAMNSANGTTGATGASSPPAAGSTPTVSTGSSSTAIAGASSLPPASSPAAGSAMVTSVGTIPTNSVPVPNTGLSGAAVTGSGNNTASPTGAPGSALRLGSSVSGLMVATLVASLIL